VAGRDPARADRVVDLHDPDTLRSATADLDVVVNASGIEDPEAVAALTEFGSAVVDITATTAYIAALEPSMAKTRSSVASGRCSPTSTRSTAS
jgi:uncharacterized protein YbjT (DUF2867 family)